MNAIFYLLSFFTMHSLTYVFIPADADPDSAVADALEPFDESREVAPYPVYLSYGERAAMAKRYKLRKNQLRKLASHIRDWTGRPGGIDEQGLYWLAHYDPNARWDWYEIGGRWDGHLPDNIEKASVLVGLLDRPDLLPADFLTPDGVWHSQSRFIPEPRPLGRWVETPIRRWRQELDEALKAFPDSDIVVVDIHS